MPLNRPLRRAVVLTAAAALALPVAATMSTSSPTSPDDQRLVATSPTNAGKVYRWGNAQWADDFIGPVKSMWSVNRPGQVNNQHGMLTINGTASGGDMVATLTGHGRRYGRWETRVRAQQYSTGDTPYKVITELVPTSGARHCGARNVVMETYRLGAGRARVALRSLPDKEFTYGKALDLRPGPFHTYAVEVTSTHISWFVDAHVVMTERRADARTGSMYKLRFRLAAVPGARMNPGRMQMDWVRYYTMARKNAQSIAAPGAHLGTYADAC
jgi:hypothetical protein